MNIDFSKVVTAEDRTREEIPASVSPSSAKIALFEHAATDPSFSNLLDQAESLVAVYPYRPVSIWWTSAPSFERDHAYINALGLELGLTVEQIDQLFITAASL